MKVRPETTRSVPTLVESCRLGQLNGTASCVLLTASSLHAHTHKSPEATTTAHGGNTDLSLRATPQSPRAAAAGALDWAGVAPAAPPHLRGCDARSVLRGRRREGSRRHARRSSVLSQEREKVR